MIYWLTFILLEVYRNYVLIEKRRIRPNYGGSFVFRAFFGLLCLILANPDFDPLVNGLDYWPFVVFECTSFWLLFDPLLNITRKKPLGYRGKTSGWLDSLNPLIYWVLKALAAFGLIFATRILLNS